jgi:hypothetical protein
VASPLLDIVGMAPVDGRRKPPALICPKCGREIAAYETTVLNRDNAYEHLHCPRPLPRAKRSG